MRTPLTRLLLPAALAFVLGACSDEPQAPTETPAPAVASAAAPVATVPTSTTPARPTPPEPAKLPVATTPYETALQALNTGTSVHFESEVTRSDGNVQFASGVGHDRNYSFSARSLPNADPESDGVWLLDNGRYFLQSPSGYGSSIVSPTSLTRVLEAISELPTTEAGLSTEKASTNLGGGVACEERTAKLDASPQLVSKYTALSACVDTVTARIVKISALLKNGERVSASFSGHGEPVEVPKSQTKDWTTEYPRTK